MKKKNLKIIVFVVIILAVLIGNHYFDNLGLFRGLFFTKKKG